MKLPRRTFLHLAASTVAVPAVSRVARADTYPSRPVRIINGFAAGGTSDIIGRVMAKWLSERLGQQFVVENRPGAGGNMATEAVAHSEPDGYTLLWTTSPNAINATLYERLNFNFVRDFAPVAGVFRVASIVEINQSFPAKSLPDFIAYAKANPGKVNMATAGNGSMPHVMGELFNYMAGVKITAVPYRTNFLPDVIGGQVQTVFDLMPSSIGYIRDGKLRALAVTTSTRSKVLPDVPTVNEFVPGYEASTWNGVSVPVNTPPAIVERLNAQISAGLSNPDLIGRLADLGAETLPTTPAEFAKLIADDVQKWAKVITFANIKPD